MPNGVSREIRVGALSDFENSFGFITRSTKRRQGPVGMDILGILLDKFLKVSFSADAIWLFSLNQK